MHNINFEDELLNRKIIDLEQLQLAKLEAKKHGGRITTALIVLGYADALVTAQLVAELYKMKTANIKKMVIAPELKNFFSKSQCEQYFIVPIFRTNTELVIAISDPLVLYAKDQLELLTKHKINTVVSTEECIRSTIESLYAEENIIPTPHPIENHSPNDEITQNRIHFVELKSEKSKAADSILISPAEEFVVPQSASAPAPLAATTATINVPVNTPPPQPVAFSATITPAPKTVTTPHYSPPRKPQMPAAPLSPLRGDVTQIVNTIINDAIRRKSSDIHIEQYEKKYRVRFRIDGLMQEAFLPTTGSSSELVGRIKVISKLDLSEKRRPQDGRTKFQVGNDKFIDLRVSVLPTLFGEKVVLRILDKGNLEQGLKSLGFSDGQLKIVEDGIQKPQGMILVTGPTGSGKTTTLYSILHQLNDVSSNIATSEDPVEFYIDGINQVQINHEIGFSFADALRAFLRQDPDVIMVGEIRDTETATVAYKAASTGHLVLSTLHTNDALSTIFRLIDMDVPKYVVAAGTSMIIAQRLLKKNCLQCVKTETVAPELMSALGIFANELADFSSTRVGSGCSECNHTGLKGRVAIHEVLEITGPIRNSIAKGVSMQELKAIAVSNGMITLRARAVQLMKQGILSYQEVFSGTVSDESENEPLGQQAPKKSA